LRPLLPLAVPRPDRTQVGLLSSCNLHGLSAGFQSTGQIRQIDLQFRMRRNQILKMTTAIKLRRSDFQLGRLNTRRHSASRRRRAPLNTPTSKESTSFPLNTTDSDHRSVRLWPVRHEVGPATADSLTLYRHRATPTLRRIRVTGSVPTGRSASGCLESYGSFLASARGAGHVDCRRDLDGLYLVCSTTRHGSIL
jgi:hypothetical protein